MVVPISRSTNTSEPSNNWPISLLCKILEKHMYNVILEHLVDYNFELSTRQSGFRSNRSTISALSSVTHDWHATLERGQEVCAIYFH